MFVELCFTSAFAVLLLFANLRPQNATVASIMTPYSKQEMGSKATHRQVRPARVFVPADDERAKLKPLLIRESPLSTLALGLGHDISNIILPLLCHLDSLNKQRLPRQAQRDLQAMRESILQLKTLTNGLALLTNEPADDAEQRTYSTSIHAWWRAMEPIVRKSLPPRVRLDMDFPETLPPVKISSQHLTSVILKLVANAAEASVGQGHIRIWCRTVDGDAARVRIGVTDNGSGMNQEISSHAREPFFTTKTRGLSTGLGLSQVDSIVTAAGGSLMIESEPGQGTTIVLDLPAEIRTPEDRARQRGARVAMQDERLQSYACALLEHMGFIVRNGDRRTVHGISDVLMVTDSSSESAARARQFVAEDPNRRVIVVGGNAHDWKSPGFIVVDGSHHSIQRELRRAVQDVLS